MVYTINVSVITVGILCRSKVLKDLQEMFEGTKYVFSGGARPQNWGGGHLRGKLIFGGGKI